MGERHLLIFGLASSSKSAMTACGSVFDSASFHCSGAVGDGAITIGVIIDTSASWKVLSKLFMNFIEEENNFGDYYYEAITRSATPSLRTIIFGLDSSIF